MIATSPTSGQMLFTNVVFIAYSDSWTVQRQTVFVDGSVQAKCHDGMPDRCKAGR
jgi:hypothetical protein